MLRPVDLGLSLYYRGCCFMAESRVCALYTHNSLQEATVHIITLPRVLRVAVYDGVAISAVTGHPNTHTRTTTHEHTPSVDSKAPCLLFCSPLNLPEERAHFNINRTLHHAVAQTCPCCIASVTLAAGAGTGGHAAEMEHGGTRGKPVSF